MKFTIVLLVFSSISFAQEVANEVAPEAAKFENNLADIMYMPAKGKFTGYTMYDRSQRTITFEYSGNEFSKTETPMTNFKQTINYALDNDKLLGLNLDYQTKSIDTTTYGPGSNKNGQSTVARSDHGLKAAAITYRQRLKSQEDNRFNLDLLMSVTPKLGDHKYATKNVEGNAYNGNTQAEVTLSLGRNNLQDGLKFDFMYSYFGEATAINAETPADVIVSDSMSAWAIGFLYQWKTSPTFVINLEVNLAYLSSEVDNNSYSHYRNNIESSVPLNLGATFVYKYSPKTNFELAISSTANVDRSFVQTNTNTQTTTTLNNSDYSTAHIALASKYEF